MRNHPAALSAALAVALSLGVAGRAAEPSTAACTPNGNVFNLEAPANAVAQYNESVAVLPGAAGNGIDLVFGTAMDERSLPPLGFIPGQSADAFYVQRGNSNCAADVEGELPTIESNTGDLYVIFGSPVVAADPAHGAFFIADLRYSGDFAVGLMKATPATLLNTAACPNPAPCFVPVAQLANVVSPNTSSGLFWPALAVDQRTTGAGAGDVYIVSAQNNEDGSTTSIALSACANTLADCSNETIVSGPDKNASTPWVQVRPDGGITVSYIEYDARTPTSAVDIRFVTCQPAGSPHAPTCTAPVAVLHEAQPAGMPGEIQLTPQYVNPLDLQTVDPTYPKHVDRLESGGVTVTTFLVYDRCDVANITGNEYFFPLCPKTDVVFASSTDGGNTWSPIQKVSNAPGQQLFGNVALDASTGTVNIAYYSSENDPLRTKMQVFLAQIPPGQSSPEAPQQITSEFYDGPLGGFNGNEGIFGSYLGVAAGGPGTAGQSRVYIHFTGSIVQGTYGGVPFPVTNNILTRFLY